MTAPNAPINLTPDGIAVDGGIVQRLAWVFSDADPGDSQSDYEVRWRPNDGVSAWTTATAALPALRLNEYHDVPAGTFASADEWEWQVRTWDALGAVGPWSASAFFTARPAPAPPTITEPVDAVTSDPATVAWSTPEQGAYRVRRVADDGAGNPDTATVYYDTGTVAGTDRSASVPFPVERTEHVQVLIEADGIPSTWASVQVSVSYTAPARPTLTITADSPTGAIGALATHPAPAGSEPIVTSVDWWRQPVDGDGNPTDEAVRLGRGAGLGPGVTFVDWQIASGQRYRYMAQAWGDNGTSTFSGWSLGPPAEDPSDPGLYLISASGLTEDPSDPGLYLIGAGSGVSEDPSDPGLYLITGV